ncbi:MAG: hypothetical protein LBJ96_04420 [Holosporaceae bacterium]|jgi:cyclase|nr:hypothetical protein [Holosporaceae bacterium]
MLKKRLIFSLLYDSGNYMLSRNFSLQKVGDLDWLMNNFDYDSIGHSIDELIILNVGRQEKNTALFCKELRKIAGKYFMPIAAGGGILSLEDAANIILSGADKLVLNTALFEMPNLVSRLVDTYGSQCIVASIDYKQCDSSVYINNGSKKSDNTDLFEAVKYVEALGCGEIYLTSMDNDGTGEGFDLETLKKISLITKLPIIAYGGGGRYDHFVKVYNECNIEAAATADLFNFMGDGLMETRRFIENSNIPMAKWDIDFFRNNHG